MMTCTRCMMSETQLIYQIADEIIVLHLDRGVEPSSVRRCLAKYTPFECTSLPEGIGPVLDVWGGCALAREAEDTLIEEVEDINYHSHVWSRPSGETYIEMTHAGLLVSALLSPSWAHLQLSVPLDSLRHRHLIDRLVMIAFSVATTPKGMLKVHASVIELRGRALIFMGVSGTGKSTHSRLWLTHIPGAQLLNDDEPIVRIMPSGQIRVYGCPWSGSTPCYRNEWADVVAFVHLYQAPHNELTKLSGRDAFNSLFSSCAFLSSRADMRMRTFTNVADVLECIPVYRLDNRPELEAVRLTHSLLS